MTKKTVLNILEDSFRLDDYEKNLLEELPDIGGRRADDVLNGIFQTQFPLIEEALSQYRRTKASNNLKYNILYAIANWIRSLKRGIVLSMVARYEAEKSHKSGNSIYLVYKSGEEEHLLNFGDAAILDQISAMLNKVSQSIINRGDEFGYDILLLPRSKETVVKIAYSIDLKKPAFIESEIVIEYAGGTQKVLYKTWAFRRGNEIKVFASSKGRVVEVKNFEEFNRLTDSILNYFRKSIESKHTLYIHDNMITSLENPDETRMIYYRNLVEWLLLEYGAIFTIKPVDLRREKPELGEGDVLIFHDSGVFDYMDGHDVGEETAAIYDKILEYISSNHKKVVCRNPWLSVGADGYVMKYIDGNPVYFSDGLHPREDIKKIGEITGLHKE